MLSGAAGRDPVAENVAKGAIIRETNVLTTSNYITIGVNRDAAPTIIYIWKGCDYEQIKEEQPKIIRDLTDVSIVQVAAGVSHVLFLSKQGCVFAFGDGEDGQLGLGAFVINAASPKIISSLKNIRQVACGSYHSVALCQEGQMYTWGLGNCLGNGRSHSRYSPETVEHFKGFSACFCCIAAALTCTLCASNSGELYVWGDTFKQFYGQPNHFYTMVSPVSIKQLAIGLFVVLLLTESGEVYIWGNGTYGEMGQTELISNVFKDKSNFIETPVKLSGKDAHGTALPPIHQIAVGERHVLLLAKDGRMFSFGDNQCGQCGVSSYDLKIAAPHIVELNENSHPVKLVHCGKRHSGCITYKHQLFLWGHASGHKLICGYAFDRMVQQNEKPGVSIRSGIKDRRSHAALIYPLLHEIVTNLCLCEDSTIVVTGNGYVVEE